MGTRGSQGRGCAVSVRHPLIWPQRRAAALHTAPVPGLLDLQLIAEAWDAGGLYQVGSFPHWGIWSEWNGQYRDTVRQFIKGTDGVVGLFAQMLCGSPNLYQVGGLPGRCQWATACTPRGRCFADSALCA